MGYESQLELSQANDVVTSFPVPTGNVQQVSLVVILHQLNNDPDIVRIILNRNDSHDVGSILSIRILTILVCQDETGVSLVDLTKFFFLGLHKKDRRKMDVTHR